MVINIDDPIRRSVREEGITCGGFDRSYQADSRHKLEHSSSQAPAGKKNKEKKHWQQLGIHEVGHRTDREQNSKVEGTLSQN